MKRGTAVRFAELHSMPIEVLVGQIIISTSFNVLQRAAASVIQWSTCLYMRVRKAKQLVFVETLAMHAAQSPLYRLFEPGLPWSLGL